MHQWWIFYEVKIPGTFISAPKVRWPFSQGVPQVPEFSIPEYLQVDGLSWFALPRVLDQVIGVFNLQLINRGDYISACLE